MNERQRKKFHPMKSELPVMLISQVPESLLMQTSVVVSSPTIVEIAKLLNTDVENAFSKILEIDKTIGGVGLYNVERQEGEEWTGAYLVEYRPLFRPFQYVIAGLTEADIEWNARDVIENACLHIEKAIKFRFGIPESNNSSLGILLDKPSIGHALGLTFLQLLKTLNRLVYRMAKHSVEEITIDRHRFTPGDALAIFFFCRWAGVEILKPTGVFNTWQAPYPRSL